mmetsp:Transcript_23914/g.56500  ORF Transcript_23914/g.56500 Transcript_23914/m.56500 type:complete len:208 (+) Transcript_23914:1015-1638(+)
MLLLLLLLFFSSFSGVESSCDWFWDGWDCEKSEEDDGDCDFGGTVSNNTILAYLNGEAFEGACRRARTVIRTDSEPRFESTGLGTSSPTLDKGLAVVVVVVVSPSIVELGAVRTNRLGGFELLDFFSSSSSSCCRPFLRRLLLISPIFDWYNSGGIVATFSMTIGKLSAPAAVVGPPAAAAVAVELFAVVVTEIGEGSSQPVSKRRP